MKRAILQAWYILWFLPLWAATVLLLFVILLARGPQAMERAWNTMCGGGR